MDRSSAIPKLGAVHCCPGKHDYSVPVHATQQQLSPTCSLLRVGFALVAHPALCLLNLLLIWLCMLQDEPHLLGWCYWWC